MVTKIFSLFFSFIICVNLHKKMRPAKRSLSVINDDVKFSVFFESQIPRRILFFCKWPMPIMQASEMIWVGKIFPHRISPLSLQRIFLKYFKDKPWNKRPCNVEFCRNQGEFVERLPFLFRHVRAKIDTWKQADTKRCTANT